ncbi:hypothetical protein ACFXAW_21830 [Streptomyces sp. NPDC059445]|uniref:hypothetical protein n=1 Tax=Streptomyces sp. NPDC059445 TaxID=3346832 RepID=UPI0036C411E0
MTSHQPAPEVRLVVTVDLAGCYDSFTDVYEDLRQQTRRNIDCHTAIIQLGEDAIRHSLSLPRAIASVFYLSAQCIEIHVPAGSVLAESLAVEVAREARSMVRDHHAHLLSIRTPG